MLKQGAEAWKVPGSDSSRRAGRQICNSPVGLFVCLFFSPVQVAPKQFWWRRARVGWRGGVSWTLVPETGESMVWTSLTFFYILQPLPHLPPNHCSGNPRQHILNSNTHCQGYLSCAGSSPNNGSSKNNTICLVLSNFVWWNSMKTYTELRNFMPEMQTFFRNCCLS